MTGPKSYIVVVADLGVPDYIQLVEGAGYGSRLSTVLSILGGVLIFGLVVGAAAVGIRWIRAKLSEKSSPSVTLMSPETRQKVRTAVSRGDFVEAGDLLAAAEETYEAADAYMRGGAYEEAARIFARMECWPRAIECYKKGRDHEMAAQMYQHMEMPLAAAAEYARGEVWDRAAEHYLEADEPRRAAQNFERAKQWLRAAEAYDRAERPLKAATLYAQHLDDRVIGGDGTFEEVPEDERERAKRAAELFRDAGKTHRASQIFLAAGYAEEAADMLRVSGDYSEAARLLREANQPELAARFLDEAGEGQEAARMRAEAALEAGDGVEAAREFSRAGEKDRAVELFLESDCYEEAAEIYEELEEHRRAMELYLEVPRYAHAARCAEMEGLLERAADYYEEAGDIDGELRVLKEGGDYFRAGRLEFEHRMYEDALETLSAIDSRDANYARSMELQGDIYRSQGRAEKAYSRYRAVLGNRKAEPATLPLLYKMGRALEDEPDLAGALDCYQKILEVDEHFEDAGLRIKAIRKRMRRGTLSGRTTTGKFSVVDADGEQEVQRYEIQEEVARGGMGIVYKARDTVLGRTVAYKILGANLRDNETAVKYFLREARAAAALSHPNIVTIYDAGEQDGEYYMAMEFVEGTTLKELIRSRGALSDKKVRYILEKCCSALDYAHNKGVIHRDITSGNVMTTRDRSLKVMDFGLAKFLKEYQNNHTQQVGTPFYMSPEQIIGKDIDFRSDLYSLGCTIFECATGTVPFHKGDLSYHHIHTEPPKPTSINPDVSEEMEEIILKLLQKDPGDRFQNAGGVLEIL